MPVNTLEKPNDLNPNIEYHKEKVDTATWLAETLEGNMRTEFEFTFDGEDLYDEDGRGMTKVFDDAIEDATELALAYPEFSFELSRRIEERFGELEDIKAMARGELPNTMIVTSEFPYAIRRMAKSAGGYDIYRQQTMQRVISLRPNGKIVLQTQSLDGSDRDGLEDIHRSRSVKPQPGELHGQRILEDLGPEEQLTLLDTLTSVYDKRLVIKHGGEWYAGRRPANRANTYDFVCQQEDLIDHYLNLSTGMTKSESRGLRYQLAAAMETRWEGRDNPRNREERLDLNIEMMIAGIEAQAAGKSYSACGETLEQDAGYGNKIEKMHCPFCKAVNYGDPCSSNQKCRSCSAEVINGKVVRDNNGSTRLGAFIANTLLKHA